MWEPALPGTTLGEPITADLYNNTLSLPLSRAPLPRRARSLALIHKAIALPLALSHCA